MHVCQPKGGGGGSGGREREREGGVGGGWQSVVVMQVDRTGR